MKYKVGDTIKFADKSGEIVEIIDDKFYSVKSGIHIVQLRDDEINRNYTPKITNEILI